MNLFLTERRTNRLVFLLPALLFFAGLFAGCPGEAPEFDPSAAPAASAATAAKTSAVQKSVTFTLTSIHPAGSVWKVYDTDTGGETLAGVFATYQKTLSSATGEPSSRLMLTSSTNDLDAGVYYVSVTERDRAESERLALTVHQP
jgi:hypothetical protein